MIRALIFDLDNCLASAKDVGEGLYAPVFEAIRRENKGVIPTDVLEKAFNEMWMSPFDWVANTFGFSGDMISAGLSAFSTLEVRQKLVGYDDLAILGELHAEKYLVTSGFRRLQESKVQALGLAPFFKAIYIDAVDDCARDGKIGIFQKILKKNKLSTSEVLVVGDNGVSEIAAGAKLGMNTVQTLRPGVPYAENATFHVHSLREMNGLLRMISAA